MGGDWAGEDATSSDVGEVFDLPDTGGEVGICKSKTLSLSFGIGVSIAVFPLAVLRLLSFVGLISNAF